MSWIRALVAVGLSILMPGAGHAVIRDWARAAVFAGLFFASIAIFFPLDQLWGAASTGNLEEMQTIVESEITMLEQFTIMFLHLFAAIDAGFQALGLTRDRGGSAGSGEPTCPQCGKPIDTDLEFCHWCTTRLERPEEPDAVDH